jgi:excisionase family DNA binding protein
MPNNIYNVKQAAKILGLSTNTTYKYLNEGRIKATRGRIRGTFIITTQALETFLGSKLPDASLQEVEKINSVSPTLNQDSEAIIEVSPPTLATKVSRILISLALLAVIFDLIFNKDTSLLSQLGRIIFITLIFLISYQFGGFIKK